MDYEEIEAVVGVLQSSRTLTELEVRSGDRVVRVRRASVGATPTAARPAAATPTITETPALPIPSPPALPNLTIVTSQLVGIFYANRTTTVSIGDAVKKEQNLGQIEAMRLMNDCTATVAGTVVGVLVEDGQPVEYGQPLFEIDPTA